MLVVYINVITVVGAGGIIGKGLVVVREEEIYTFHLLNASGDAECFYFHYLFDLQKTV